MKIKYAILFIILAISCINNKDNNNYNNKDNNNISTSTILQKINLEDVKLNDELNDKLKLSERIDSAWYIKLETSEDCLFGEIDQIEIFDNSIFILDCSNAMSLLEFDLEGRFLRKFGKIGKGPGEYIKPMNFSIDKQGKKILVFDDRLKRITYFNRNGSFYKDIKIPFITREICVLDSNTIICNNRKAQNKGNKLGVYCHFLTQISSHGELISNLHPYNEDVLGLRYRDNTDFYSSNNNVLYHNSLGDTIYRVQKKVITPKYVIDFGNKSLPEGFDRNIDFREFKEKYKGVDKNYAMFLGKFYEFKNKLYFQIKYKDRPIDCIYYQANNSVVYGNLTSQDFNKGVYCFNPIGVYDECIISSFDPGRLLMLDIKNNNSLRIIKEKTKISDNPILTFYKFK